MTGGKAHMKNQIDLSVVSENSKNSALRIAHRRSVFLTWLREQLRGKESSNINRRLPPPPPGIYCIWELHEQLLDYFYFHAGVCVPAEWQTKQLKIRIEERQRRFLLDPTNIDQLTFASYYLVDGVSFWGLLYLSQLDLSRVGGEEEHDGEACQKPSILNGKGEQEASAACVLFFATHLIHFRKLSRTKMREINARVSDVFLIACIKNQTPRISITITHPALQFDCVCIVVLCTYWPYLPGQCIGTFPLPVQRSS